MKIRQVLIFTLLSVCFCGATYSQESTTYVSFLGGFQVNLPSDIGGFSGMGSGFRLVWRQPEAKYEIGFHEVQGMPLAQVDGEFSYEEAVRRYFNQFSAVGERIHKKDAFLQNHPGFEYKFKTRESTLLLRLFVVGDRVYQLQAQIPLEKAPNEQRVMSIFDSVKLISKEATARHFAKQIADATPAELPQSPKIPKPKSDLQDRGLIGPVKSIRSGFAKYALNDSLKQRYTTKYEEFDRDGNLVRAVDFDSHGAPLKVTGYGYVAGKRVARIGIIEQEGTLSSTEMGLPYGSKFDKRFDEYFAYKYLSGKLAEEHNFGSNGILFRRATYRYVKDVKITEYFDGGTRAFQRIVANLDGKGNEVKLTYFKSEGRKWLEEARFDVKYDSFDEKENWTQRTTSRWYGMDNKGKSFPEHVEYRSIEYYQ